eukprot:TRINITY_DN7375_c0_g1_i1.p1 TRINITY_DN7375_c0_g1~~TRINITY_DN7375_c0_g1_i1.p1  ORF type:complete len:368 (-),score=64.30 TRINITY_DN7375_c0_g1_i1:145-1200(-)
MAGFIAFCKQAFHRSTGVPVADGNNYERPPPGGDNAGQVRMLICALDYKLTDNPLTCTLDGNNIQQLAGACGIQDLTVMYDEECTMLAVSKKLEEICRRCEQDDYFVFYFSGHGINVEDKDDDEEDGQDEAFCFVNKHGKINVHTIMTDDQFAKIITSSIHDQVRVLILTDCCHSGTIADLHRPEWENIEALSMAGCLDNQTSGDIGSGGIMTHSMLLAIEKLQHDEEAEYSTGLLYNNTLTFDDKIFASAQEITIQTTAATAPDMFAWPLLPRQTYVAPMTQASTSKGVYIEGLSTGDSSDGPVGGNVLQLVHTNQNKLMQEGISPSVARHITGQMDDSDDEQAGGCAIQ